MDNNPNGSSQIPLTHFQFRLSDKKPRDVQLSYWIKADTESGNINISEVTKDLLYAWYIQRQNGGAATPSLFLPLPTPSLPKHEEGEELMDRGNPLVQNLLNLEFDPESM